ncbi:hypothetical protein GCM10027030_27590 [Luteococcus sediminum]
MWLTLQPSGRDSDDIPVPHRVPERGRDIERQRWKVVHQRLGPKDLPRSVPITRNTNGCCFRERDHRAAPGLHQVETARITRDTFPHQRGDGLVIRPDAGGLSPNTWERLERLSHAWEQAKHGLESEGQQAPEPEIAVVANPTRRSRTPLAQEEVDAIRTARSNGESAMSIARRFEVSRMTVWEKTRERLR